MEPEPEAELPLFGQPLHRLQRRRDPRGVPVAIAHVARTIHSRLGLPGASVDALPAARGSSDPSLVRLQMQLEARDDADLELFSVAQLFLVLDVWLGMLPSAVVAGALVEEYLAVWQRHDDASAAVLAARTLSAERRALLDVMLGVLSQICECAQRSDVGVGSSSQSRDAEFIAQMAPSVVGPASLVGSAEAPRLVALWLASSAELGDGDGGGGGDDDDEDEDEDYVTERFAVYLNFFIDPHSASGPVYCGRVPVTQGVTQLGSAWAKAQGWTQPSLLGAKQYQLLANLESGFITLKVLAEEPPTRYKGARWSRAVVLARDMVQELQSGDSLSFPGGRFIFEVEQTKGAGLLPAAAAGEMEKTGQALQEEEDALAAYMPPAAAAVGPGSLPRASFGARSRLGQGRGGDGGGAGGGGGSEQRVDQVLQTLRTDILKQFEDSNGAGGSGGGGGGRFSTAATASAVAARSSAVAGQSMGDEDEREDQQRQQQQLLQQQLLQAELERVRAELAEERQRREDAERRLRSSGSGGSAGRSNSDGASERASAREVADLQVALAATKARQEADGQQLFEVQQLLKQKDREVTEAKKQMMAEKQRLWAESDLRRKLHNDLQEIKGNIRVLARIRPIDSYSPKRRANAEINCRVVDSDSLVDNHIAIYNGSRKAQQSFEFDACFSNGATNADVFDEVSAAITSVLDGYNVSMMAYGQTGSGKTHTMHGTVRSWLSQLSLRSMLR
jgi:hypothetical protein